MKILKQIWEWIKARPAWGMAWVNKASWRGWVVHGGATVAWQFLFLGSDRVPEGGADGLAWYYLIREAGHLAQGKGKPTDRVPEWLDRLLDVGIPWAVTLAAPFVKILVWG